MNNQAIEAGLRKTLGELEERLTKVRSDMSKGHSADFAEQVTERENDEVLEGIAAETQASISDIRAALSRIHDGTYGVCIRCGGAINAERLTAMPETALCMTCASA